MLHVGTQRAEMLTDIHLVHRTSTVWGREYEDALYWIIGDLQKQMSEAELPGKIRRDLSQSQLNKNAGQLTSIFSKTTTMFHCSILFYLN